MKKNDRENEYVGIVSITVIVILAVVMLYYFYVPHPSVSKGTNIPVEAPAPKIDKNVVN